MFSCASRFCARLAELSHSDLLASAKSQFSSAFDYPVVFKLQLSDYDIKNNCCRGHKIVVCKLGIVYFFLSIALMREVFR